VREYVPPPGSIPTLPVPDLRGLRSLHMVGIGGAGMSGMARLLLAQGVRIFGTDLKESPPLVQLRAIGAHVRVGHAADHLSRPDAVVVSTAIPHSNPEVVEARRRGIPVLARAQVLAALMRDRRSVAVAGTHGKTSTTSMLAVILEEAGLDPTYLVGGDLNESGSNARSGAGDIFVAEADESDGSFLLLQPDIAVVTNVEHDHLDFFPSGEEVEAAFVTFCRRAPLVVACADDPGARRVVEAGGARVLWYGRSEDAAVRLEDSEATLAGSRAVIRTSAPDVQPWVGKLVLPVPGLQYLTNAAGAVAAAAKLGVPPRAAVESLRRFGGVRRRWEHRGEARGAAFVDDYAHHPTEIEATLATARADGDRRVVAVFQPHRYSRTAAMWRPLGESLAAADVVVLTDVYGAGELPVPGVSGKLLVDALVEAAPGKRAIYLPRRRDVAVFLSREVRVGDLVVTMGAGDITMVADETLSLLREAAAGGG